MYVLFEGVDTSGKSTQLELYAKNHPQSICTHEPGKTPFGKQIRELLLNGDYHICPKAELFLFLADRSEHYEQIIKPNLNKLIISDRGFISGLAYALINENKNFELLMSMNKFALDENLPEKIVFFKTNETTLKQRLKDKFHDKIETRGIDYLLKVQDKMQEIIEFLAIKTLEVQADENRQTIQNQIEEFLK